MMDPVRATQSAGNLEWKPNILRPMVSRVCCALTGPFNVFFSFYDVGYGINTRKRLHVLEIEREISVLRPSLKRFVENSLRGQICCCHDNKYISK